MNIPCAPERSILLGGMLKLVDGVVQVLFIPFDFTSTSINYGEKSVEISNL